MEEVQNVEGEAEVEAVNIDSMRMFDKLSFYKFTSTWRFDVSVLGKNPRKSHEFASPVIRTRQEDNNFNFTWRLAFSRNAHEKFYNTLTLSLLSFDKRHLEVCVRCYFEDELSAEKLAKERAFDFSSEAPIQKEFTLRRIRPEGVYEPRLLGKLVRPQFLLPICEKDKFVIRVDFEFFELDHRVRIMKLTEDLKTLLKHNDEPTDVTFQIGEKELKAHKCVLAARSPVFAKMFEGQETQDNRYSIDDIEADVFQLLLTFVYYGKTEDAWNAKKMTKLRLAAEKFGLTV